MPMKVKVHMLAFMDDKCIREVELPYDKKDVKDEDILDDVFYYGQNENCTDRAITSKIPSVSVGDVIELPNARNYMVSPMGFREMKIEELQVYIGTDRQDRWKLQYNMD